jgi:hypothetical protein
VSKNFYKIYSSSKLNLKFIYIFLSFSLSLLLSLSLSLTRSLAQTLTLFLSFLSAKDKHSSNRHNFRGQSDKNFGTCNSTFFGSKLARFHIKNIKQGRSSLLSAKLYWLLKTFPESSQVFQVY